MAAAPWFLTRTAWPNSMRSTANKDSTKIGYRIWETQTVVKPIHLAHRSLRDVCLERARQRLNGTLVKEHFKALALRARFQAANCSCYETLANPAVDDQFSQTHLALASLHLFSAHPCQMMLHGHHNGLTKPKLGWRLPAPVPYGPLSPASSCVLASSRPQEENASRKGFDLPRAEPKANSWSGLTA